MTSARNQQLEAENAKLSAENAKLREANEIETENTRRLRAAYDDVDRERHFNEKKTEQLEYENSMFYRRIKELEAENAKLRADIKKQIQDWCDDDEDIKQQALRVLDPKIVEGDTYVVPRMGALAELMVDECLKVNAENANLREYADHKQTCQTRRLYPYKCDCGFDEMAKGGDT